MKLYKKKPVIASWQVPFEPATPAEVEAARTVPQRLQRGLATLEPTRAKAMTPTDLYTPCPHCDGRGYVVSEAGMCKRCQGNRFVLVGVKALEWVDLNPKGCKATSVVGTTYELFDLVKGECMNIYITEVDDSVKRGVAVSIDAAKAACQAHFEQSIFNQLEVM